MQKYTLTHVNNVNPENNNIEITSEEQSNEPQHDTTPSHEENTVGHSDENDKNNEDNKNENNIELETKNEEEEIVIEGQVETAEDVAKQIINSIILSVVAQKVSNTENNPPQNNEETVVIVETEVIEVKQEDIQIKVEENEEEKKFKELKAKESIAYDDCFSLLRTLCKLSSKEVSAAYVLFYH